MTIALEVAPDAAAAARRVGALIAERARHDIANGGQFAVALSRVPPGLIEALVTGRPSITQLYS